MCSKDNEKEHTAQINLWYHLKKGGGGDAESRYIVLEDWKQEEICTRLKEEEKR